MQSLYEFRHRAPGMLCAALAALLTLSVTFHELSAQIPNCAGAPYSWEYAMTPYNLSGGQNPDWAEDVAVAPPALGSGYFAAGYSQTYHYQGAIGNVGDMFAVLTDLNGTVIRDGRWGGQDDDIAHACLADDNGFLMVGATESYGSGLEDIFIVRVDWFFGQQWALAIGGSDSDIGWAVEEVSDANGGGYIVAGTTRSFGFGPGSTNFYVIRLRDDGSVMWERSYGSTSSTDYNEARAIAEFDDGVDAGFVIAGFSNSRTATKEDGVILWIDHAGTVLRSRTYISAAAGAGDVRFEDVEPIGTLGAHSGYALTGTVANSATSSDILVLRTDVNGDIAGGGYAREINAQPGSAYPDAASDVEVTGNGELVVSGESKGFFGNEYSLYLTVLDGTGTATMARAIGAGATNNVQRGAALAFTADGGFLLGGRDNGQDVAGDDDLYVVKLDCNVNGGVGCRVQVVTPTESTFSYTRLNTSYLYEQSHSTHATITVLQGVEDHGNILICSNGQPGDPVNDCCPQVPKPTWQSHVGVATELENGNGVIHANQNGEYAIVGVFRDPYFPGRLLDGFLSTFDAQGDRLMTWAYGDERNDGFNAGVEGRNGGMNLGYAMAGYNEGRLDDQVPYSLDAWWVFADYSGILSTDRVYGGQGHDEFHDIQSIAAGVPGYIMVGQSNSFNGSLQDSTHDVYVVRTDVAGTPLWAYVYGGDGDEVGRAVTLVANDDDVNNGTGQGGFLVVGETDSFGPGQNSVYALRIDPNGNILWARTYGGSYDDVGYSVEEVSDAFGDGFIIAAETDSHSSGFSTDAFVFRIDYNGNYVPGAVRHVYGGFAQQGQTDRAFEVKPLECGDGYIFVGETNSAGRATTMDAWAVNIDEMGAINWSRVYGLNSFGDEGEFRDVFVNWNSTPAQGEYFTFAGTNMNPTPGTEDAYIVTAGCNGATQESGVDCRIASGPLTGVSTASLNVDVTLLTVRSVDLAQYNWLRYSEDDDLTFVVPEYRNCYEPAALYRRDEGPQPSSEVEITAEVEAGVYPNPVSAGQSFGVVVDLEDNQAIEIRVANLVGEVFSTTSQSGYAGRNVVEFNTQGWSAGSYLVEIILADGTSRRAMLTVR